MPYWSAIRNLRTDTCGAAAFVPAAVSLTVSEYLRLRRFKRNAGELAVGGTRPVLAALAAGEAVAVLSTLLIAYLSINAVTHPGTLAMPSTHFAAWPAEGTLRVLALGSCLIAVGAVRYLRVYVGIGRSHARVKSLYFIPRHSPGKLRHGFQALVPRPNCGLTGSGN